MCITDAFRHTRRPSANETRTATVDSLRRELSDLEKDKDNEIKKLLLSYKAEVCHGPLGCS